MPHYICLGTCKGTSGQPGVCRADECEKHGKVLVPCECADGEHFGATEEREERQGDE